MTDSNLENEESVEIYGILEGGETSSARVDILFEDITVSKLDEITENILTPIQNEPEFS